MLNAKSIKKNNKYTSLDFEHLKNEGFPYLALADKFLTLLPSVEYFPEVGLMVSGG